METSDVSFRDPFDGNTLFNTNRLYILKSDTKMGCR